MSNMKEGRCVMGEMRKDRGDIGEADLRKRIDELENSLSIALEINESHQRYNGKLQRRLTELEEENEKLKKQISDHIENKMETYRKSGM